MLQIYYTTTDSENVIQGTEKQTERTDSEIVNDALAFINPDNSMKTIPESYLKTINEAGRVERFEYVTSEGKNKHALVYLPYGYNEETKYDVIYWMHGGGGSAEWVLGTEGEKNELTLILDNLIANKDMRPVIFVAASFYPEEGADSSVATADRLVKLFPDEWSDDLVPALESHYSTYADSTDKAGLIASRDHRSFGGFSMGSVTTWYIFMEKLPLVSTFFPISGDCWSEGRQAGSSKSEETANDLKEALDASGYGINDFYIYAVTGTDDIAQPHMTPMLTAMRQLTDTFRFDTDRTKGNIRYRVKNGGVHSMTDVKLYFFNIFPEIWSD